jgi:hypothetical protein
VTGFDLGFHQLFKLLAADVPCLGSQKWGTVPMF